MIICVYFNPTIDKTIYLKRFILGGTNRPESVMLDGAGKAINVAVVLKALGKNPSVIGLLNIDDGIIIKNKLDDNQISYEFLEISGHCRVNTKIFDDTTKEITEINEKGTVVDENIIRDVKNKVYNTARKNDVVVLTGSLPPGCPDDTYAEMIETLNKRGVKCVLDADGSVLVKGVAKVPYFIKPNIDELKVLIGKDVSSTNQVYDAATRLIDMGIAMVCVSMGKDGAFLFTRDSAYKAEPLKLDVKSTVGAGDSMVAGIVANLDKDPKSALRAGCAAASASITLEGTKLTTKELFGKMYDNVKVEKYSKDV